MDHKTVFTNTLSQFVTRSFSSLVTFIITILLARVFGAAGYGDFTKVVAFVGLFYFCIDFGLNAIYLQKDNVGKFHNLVFVRLTIAVLLFVIASTLAFLLPYQNGIGFSESVKLGILIYSFTFFSQALVLSSLVYFQKHLQFSKATLASFFGSLATLLLVIFSLQFSPSLISVLVSLVLGGFVTALLSLYFVKEKPFTKSLHTPFIKELTKESLPLAIMLGFNLIYFRSDMIILSFFKSAEDVGIYGFSYRFFDFLITLPLFLSNSLYPLMLENIKNTRRYTRMLKTYSLVFLGLSLLLIMPFWFLSPLVYFVKPEFLLSVLPFRILLLSLPFFFLSNFLQWNLITQKQSRFLLFVYGVSTVLNIILNLIFILQGSYIAAATITLFSEMCVCIVLAVQTLRLASQKIMRNEIQV